MLNKFSILAILLGIGLHYLPLSQSQKRLLLLITEILSGGVL